MWSYASKESLDVIATNPGKYIMEDTSVLSAKLQRWWVFVADHMPTCLSANLITVGAAFPMILSWILSSYYAFMGETMPKLVQILGGISVFFFQTMDAVDGKCARKYGTSSSLGDFLDHVMDSISIMLCGFLLAHAFTVDSNPITYFALICVSLNFVVIHWESAKILVMRLDNGSSITEAQIGFTLILFVAPIFGLNVWRTVVFGPVTLGRLAAGGLICAITVMQCIKSFSRVHEKCGWSPFSELLIPIAYQIAIAVLWCVILSEKFCFVPFEMITLAVTVIHSCAITLNRLAHQPILPTTTLPVVIPALVLPFFGEKFAWIAGFWAVSYMLFFLTGIVTAIANRLSIPIFAQPKNAKLN